MGIDISTAINIDISVTTKQNNTYFPSHADIKSDSARSLKRRTGSGIKNTNLFILLTKASLKTPILLKVHPITIKRNMGMVTFSENIRFSICYIYFS